MRIRIDFNIYDQFFPEYTLIDKKVKKQKKLSFANLFVFPFP